MVKDRKKKVSLAYTIVIVSGSVTLLLLLFIFMLSFFSSKEYATVYGDALNGGITSQYISLKLLPVHFSMGQYLDTLWRNSDFWYYFWNSVAISLPIMIGITVIGSLGGYAFARYNFPGKKILLFVFVLLMMVPYQVFLAPQFRVLYEMGLLKSKMSVILPNIFAPFGAYMIYQYVGKLPEEEFEAARIDGAGEVRLFCSIALPQLRSGIGALLLLNLIDTWNMVEQPLVFLADEYLYPLSVALNKSGSENGMLGFVGCIIFMIPLFLVFMLGKERMIEGIGESVVGR